MAKTVAERQQEFRKRVNAATIALLQAKLEAAIERENALDVTVADLEADLEQERNDRRTPRCQQCGTPLACPACHGGGEYA